MKTETTTETKGKNTFLIAIKFSLCWGLFVNTKIQKRHFITEYCHFDKTFPFITFKVLVLKMIFKILKKNI
jgi:hypothetical protein